MGKENDSTPKLTLEDKEAELQAKDYRSKAAGITKNAGIRDKLGFDYDQMRLFNSRFAHALSVKETADNERRLHSGLYIAAERFGISSYLDMINKQIDIDKLTSQILKESFEAKKKVFAVQVGGISPYQIANAANFLSSLYLDCKEERKSFKKAVEENIDYLKRQFLKVD